MKTFIIFTHKTPELEKFVPLVDGYWNEESVEHRQLLVILRNRDQIFSEELRTILEGLNKVNVIILHHGDIFDSGGDYFLLEKFSTRTNCADYLQRTNVKKEDWMYYHKLINEKMLVFDEVWNHFIKPDPHEAALTKLHRILNGDEPLELNGVKASYNNNDEKHRKALSELRDKLLTN